MAAGYADLYQFTAAVPKWYAQIQIPAFIPPPIIIFYGIIAISFLLWLSMFMIWNAGLKHHEAWFTLGLFAFGLILNVVWFSVFFSWHSVVFALVMMFALLLVLVCTVYQALRSAILSVLPLTVYLIVMVVVGYANLLIYLQNPNLPLW
jgi:tryptophan-rich sensory protein